MTFARTILGATFLVAIATSATAQYTRSTTKYFGSEEAMNELAAFGRCYAKRNRADALSLIATRPTSREEVQVYRKLFSGDNLVCLIPGTELNLPPAYVRGAIAEGLLRAGEGIPAGHVLPAPVAAEVRNLSDAARCYAAGHRDQVQAVLATKPATKQELAAVSAAMGGFEACLPAGVKVEFDSTVIRYRLAEALLRLPPPATAASGR